METSGHGDGAGQLDFAVACWMWMVPGRLGAWLPAFVVLWNACRLGAGLGLLAGLLDPGCGWCLSASVSGRLGAWLAGCLLL